MKILGINPGVSGLNFHDTSSCLIGGTTILYAEEEERLSRVRHSSGIFPALTVARALEMAADGGIDVIAVGHDPAAWGLRDGTERPLLDASHNVATMVDGMQSGVSEVSRLTMQIQSLVGVGPDVPVEFWSHHYAHAISAVRCRSHSQPRCLCIVADGVGEVSSLTVWDFDGGKGRLLEEWPVSESLGYFYAAMTAYCGFRPWSDEGKLMALAPYGAPSLRLRETFDALVDGDSGQSQMNRLITACLTDGFYFDVDRSVRMLEERFGVPAQKASDLSEISKGVAHLTQRYIERVVVSLARSWLERTGADVLCVAGGLFMNCKLNGVLRDSIGETAFFVQPVSGDAGVALGAAICSAAARQVGPDERFDLQNLSLGSSAGEFEVFDVWREDDRVDSLPFSEALEPLARLLASGEIVFWVEGRMELGARALGHRSILTTPSSTEVSRRINASIKHREMWRPFACAVLAEMAAEVLVGYRTDAAYMIEAYPVAPLWKERLAGVVHEADGSTRPQVVHDAAPNRQYHALIDEFYRQTGVPALLNTSLNDRGEPLIHSYQRAFEFFMETPATALVLDGQVLFKRPEDTL